MTLTSVDVKAEALHQLEMEAAGVIDAAIDALTKAKLQLAGGSTVATREHQANAAGITESIFQSLIDEPPVAINSLIANIDVHDEYEHEQIVDGVQQEYRQKMRSFMRQL